MLVPTEKIILTTFELTAPLRFPLVDSH